MAVQLYERPVISEDDEEFGAIDCTPYLDEGETITSVAQMAVYDVVIVDGKWTPGALNAAVLITNETPSTAVLTILDRPVAIGCAVQFNIAGHSADTDYLIRYTITTSAGRVATRDAPLRVAA